eukprot:GEZU01003905.1.p2 GENE.GEZU01003905.1~~GEZU01003905.1.p2  ORF type:complete len:131 (-),score=15.28 GEZU01003905.1:344-694(-)
MPNPLQNARGRLLFVRLIRSPAHQVKAIRDSVAVLHLRKINQERIVRDTPSMRGLIYKARHLLHVEAKYTDDLFPEGYTQFLPPTPPKSAQRLKQMHAMKAAARAAKHAENSVPPK